jgi:polysaccharide export outer membrane protein
LAVLTATSHLSAQDAYRIRAGDVLRIEVIEDPSLNRSALVSPDGRITLPLAGGVIAAGRSVEEVQADLSAGLAANFAAPPNVFVSVERLAEVRPAGPVTPAEAPTISVFVLGEVNSPGELTVAPGTTILQLFAQMGGFDDFAATRRIQLRRVGADGTEAIYVIDYQAIENGTSPNGTATLIDGDVIVVPQRRLFE